MESVRKRFEEYAGVQLTGKMQVVEEVDHYTSSFMDGQYSLILKLDPEQIKAVLACRPPWATSVWLPGRQRNLAAMLTIPTDDGLFSLTGEEGHTIFKILTVDARTGTIYFEMKAY